MAYTSYPYVDQATTDVEYSRLFRHFSRSGVVGSFASSAGADGTELSGTVGTGLRTILQPGSAILRGYFFRMPDPQEMVHDAGDSQPRYDRVILRLDLNQPIGDRIKPAVVKGDPAASPAVPALVQTDTGIFEIPCYYVLVPANATGFSTGNITPEKRYIYNTWTTGRRPEIPVIGRDFGYNITTKSWEFYDGDGWKHIAQGLSYNDLSNKPSATWLDGTTVFKQDAAPTAAQGANGDVVLEY
jgi:hypothetical protein